MKLRTRARGLSRILPLNALGQRLSSFIFMFLALCLFMYSALWPDNMQALKLATADLFSPVIAVVNYPVQQAAGYVRTVSGIAALQEENMRLQQENARLREWYQKALVLKSENESLHKLLNVHTGPAHSFVTARVVIDQGNAYVNTLLVMAGSNQGVEKGQAVLAGEGLAGRVIEAGRKASRVLLLTDINSRVPVMVENTDYQGILSGTGDGIPALRHLPADAEMQEGARVMTSGRGGLFPYGLPVGTIYRAGDGKWGVRLYANAQSAVFVRVINAAEDPQLRSGIL